MSNNQQQPQQPQQPGVVVSIEEVGQTGQKVDKESVPKKGKKQVLDISTNEGMALTLANLCEEAGFHEQASMIRNKPYEKTLSAKFTRGWKHKVTVGDVVTVILVGATLFIVYEYAAMKFDLPRVGVFKTPEEALNSMAKKK